MNILRLFNTQVRQWITYSRDKPIELHPKISTAYPQGYKQAKEYLDSHLEEKSVLSTAPTTTSYISNTKKE